MDFLSKLKAEQNSTNTVEEQDQRLMDIITNQYSFFEKSVKMYENQEEIYKNKFENDVDFEMVLERVVIKSVNFYKSTNQKKIESKNSMFKEIENYLRDVYNIKHFNLERIEEKLFNEEEKLRCRTYDKRKWNNYFEVPFIKTDKQFIVDQISSIGNLENNKKQNTIDEFVNTIGTYWGKSRNYDDKKRNVDASRKDNRLDIELYYTLRGNSFYSGDFLKTNGMKQPIKLDYSSSNGIHQSLTTFCKAVNLYTGYSFTTSSLFGLTNNYGCIIDLGKKYDDFNGCKIFKEIKLNKSGIINIWFANKEEKIKFMNYFGLICKTTYENE